MRNYQLEKNNPYHLPKNVYMQMFYLIRDYDELKKRHSGILHSSPPPPDGTPRGSRLSNPTEERALVRAALSEQLEAIDRTIAYLRGKYSKTYTGEEFDPYEAYKDYGVFCYYRSKPGRDSAPTTKTWSRYRSEFAWNVARNLYYI